jgi:hypothetical protein
VRGVSEAGSSAADSGVVRQQDQSEAGSSAADSGVVRQQGQSEAGSSAAGSIGDDREGLKNLLHFVLR